MSTLAASAAVQDQGSPSEDRQRILVLACGALVNELQAIIGTQGLAHVDLECLPAKLHNRPALIAGAARERIARLQGEGRAYNRILLGYADCGTAGALDDLCAELTEEASPQGASAAEASPQGASAAEASPQGASAAEASPVAQARGDALEVVRIPGAHCYEFFATAQLFAEMSEAEPATFYLTDFLARHFELLVWKGLGIADHPELAELYFGNYERVVLLTQTPNDADRARIEQCARAGAERLGLPLEIVETRYGELETAVVHIAAPRGRSVPHQESA